MQCVCWLFAGSFTSKPRSANIFFSETKQNLFLILVQEKASAASGKNEYLDDVAAVAAIKRAPPHTSVRLDRNRHDTREFAQFLTTAAAAEAHKIYGLPLACTARTDFQVNSKNHFRPASCLVGTLLCFLPAALELRGRKK